MSFRMMPAQRIDLAPEGYSTRWGFLIKNHPRGIRESVENLDLEPGDYVASWDSSEKAIAAAICLGVETSQVQDMGFFQPKADDVAEWNR